MKLGAEPLRRPKLGLTIDEQPDYELLKKVIEHFGESAYTCTCQEIVQLLDKHKSWIDLNKSVRRKGNT